jgi:hypothetical protein
LDVGLITVVVHIVDEDVFTVVGRVSTVDVDVTGNFPVGVVAASDFSDMVTGFFDTDDVITGLNFVLPLVVIGSKVVVFFGFAVVVVVFNINGNVVVDGNVVVVRFAVRRGFVVGLTAIMGFLSVVFAEMELNRIG